MHLHETKGAVRGIWWALPGLHLSEVGAVLRDANYWWILPGVAVYFVGLAVRAWRWHYMLRHIKPISTKDRTMV